ncbi:hypothetical protein [Motiliproteus coralliicola]|uniref:hypothetical protein n=1 Tax=Motiliproteus coralliicola TaxID=2283196 RepID=UPI0010586B65|nr:hypothetical protein [Motiliproteus coralliicola]
MENAPLLVVVLVAILLVALLANYLVYRRQERALQRALKLKQLRLEAEKVLEALAVLNQIDCPKPARELLNQEVVRLLEQISRIKPEAGMLEQLRSQSDTIVGDSGSLNLENERAMKQAHAAIRFAIRFANHRRSIGALSSLQCDELSGELQRFDYQIEIDTHLGIGKRLLESDKPAVATTHFKQAKSFISRLHHQNPQRRELLEQVNELIAQALPFGTQARQQDKNE